MSEKKLPVITINRQYAAYGRTIADKVSERLGIPYYDKDFVKKTVAESGFDLDAIMQDGEDITSRMKWINDIMNIAVGSYPDYVKRIFAAEQDVILDLAKSPCIIVGRCANYVLQQAGIPSFDVFCYGDLEKRKAHAAELDEAQGKDLAKYIEMRDTHRNNFYKTFVGTDIDDCTMYTICLDTCTISPDDCADIIVRLVTR